MRKILTIAITATLLLLVTSSTLAYSTPNNRAGIFTVSPPMALLGPSFNPTAPVGGVPFCFSGSRGNIMCYPPNFLKTAYDFPIGLDGTGSTIVIVDAFGSPTAQSDLNTYDTTFSLPATTVTVLCPPTWTGAPTDVCPVKTISDLSTAPNAALCGAVGWAEETTLDITQSHALAPGAKIVLVVAADCFDTSILAAQQAVVSQKTLKGSIMSQSFGQGEDALLGDPAGFQAQADAMYQTATNNKWTLLASSADFGAETDFPSTTLIPSWPSTSPLVISAGGTQGYPFGGQYGFPPGSGNTFSCAAGATCNTGLVIINGGANGCGTATRPGEPSSCFPTSYGREGAWNEWNWEGAPTSTGGGISTLYSRPTYQAALSNSFPTLLGSTASAANARLVPDISFNSAVSGGVLAYLGFLGAWAVFGGTSASSPALAAEIALMNQVNGGPVGFITPAIYNLAQSSLYSRAFHDIVQGNNSATAGIASYDGFTAGTGYDLTTGWGTPDVASFIPGVLFPNLNLAGKNLQKANLQGLNLQGANVQGSNLQNANLQNANLQGANIQGSNLQGANLQGANLSGAKLQGANLQGANMNNANLTNANFTGANCQSSTDSGATTTGVVTTGSNACP
ncbi:MAG: pentapeptide repeat-containing protein [Candidatus Bathyarchaeia archaeon]|jgi:subtilase family serine protease